MAGTRRVKGRQLWEKPSMGVAELTEVYYGGEVVDICASGTRARSEA